LNLEIIAEGFTKNKVMERSDHGNPVTANIDCYEKYKYEDEEVFSL